VSGRRGTITLEDGEILEHRSYDGNQHILRVRAPRAAARAAPGAFAHLTCSATVPMRRPLSIMRADPDAGWLEFLYKPVGAGLTALTRRRPGERLSVLAPIGNGFTPHPDRPRWLALGGGVGIPPMIFLAERMRGHAGVGTTVLMGSEVPFPFDLVPTRLRVAGAPESATHAVALLEEWGVPSRLASKARLPGAFDGFVTELAASHLAALSAAELAATQLFACGPEPMLRASAALARRFAVPCQLALEEFMACGVGGCAGCTVLLHTATGPAMKRVCVDGPVFDAREVYPA
jgi:dihydroorotate dehydrogenase electron transfer subunit